MYRLRMSVHAFRCSETSVAVSCFERLAPHVPGAQAIVYDTALRGVHHQTILRELGFVPVNMVAAAETFGSKTLKRKIKRREKTVHVEDKEVTRSDGSTLTVRLFSEAGAIGLMRPTEAGDLQFAPLARKRTHRMKADNGLYRWYNDYRLPEHLGGGQIAGASSTGPRTSDRSRLRTLTSRASTGAGTTPSRSTGRWRTPCSSDELTASDGGVSRSRCSAGP